MMFRLIPSQKSSRYDQVYKKYADDYVALLEFHIDKENNVLFPLAIQHLSEKELAELKHGFDKIESEKIGRGTHERFHRMLEEFERLYME